MEAAKIGPDLWLVFSHLPRCLLQANVLGNVLLFIYIKYSIYK